MAKRIAIVEDDPDQRSNYVDAITKKGYDVIAYSNRREALEGFERDLPDLAILDIILGDEVDAGFEICRDLLARSNSLPVIFLTERIAEIDKISGQFPSRELFLNALALQRLTLEMLKASIEKRLMEQEFLRSQVVPKVNVDDASVKKYYQENTGMFHQPEKLTVYHIFAKALHLKDAGKASDPALQKKADRLMALIDKDALNLIETILVKIKKGEDFSELAKKYSEDDASKDKGGLIGAITDEQTLPEIFQAASKLKTGETSGVVKSNYGYHIVKVTEKIPAKTAALSEVKSDILNVLMKIEVQKKKEAILLEMRKSADIKMLL